MASRSRRDRRQHTNGTEHPDDDLEGSAKYGPSVSLHPISSARGPGHNLRGSNSLVKYAVVAIATLGCLLIFMTWRYELAILSSNSKNVANSLDQHETKQNQHDVIKAQASDLDKKIHQYKEVPVAKEKVIEDANRKLPLHVPTEPKADITETVGKGEEGVLPPSPTTTGVQRGSVKAATTTPQAPDKLILMVESDLIPPEHHQRASPLQLEKLRASSGDPKVDLEYDWWQYTYFQQTRYVASLPVLERIKVQSLKPNPPSILCAINTISPYHGSRGAAVRDTWGKKCDKLIFYSNATDDSLPAVKVEADDTHVGLWMKHRAYAKMLYDEYLDKYEWFFKADDDSYVIMENLQNYLASPEIQKDKDKPLILGHRRVLPRPSLAWEFVHEGAKISQKSHQYYDIVYQKYPLGFAFTVGGCGYAMNRAYLKALVETMDEDYCLPHDLVPDDWALQFCMQFKGIHPVDTRDSLQKERFHQFEPWRTFRIDASEFTFNIDHPWGFRNGTDCCSEDTIAFHYMFPMDIYMLHHHFYREPLIVPDSPRVCEKCYQYRGQ